MKKLTSILVIALATLSAHSQFVSGPIYQHALTNAGAVPLLCTNMSENAVATTRANVCTVGPNGFGFFATIGSTNAAATTNGGVVVEFISHPSNAGANNSTLQTATLTLTPNGTGPYYYWTNVPATIANVGNLRGVRLKYITNGNTHTLWVTNAYFVTR